MTARRFLTLFAIAVLGIQSLPSTAVADVAVGSDGSDGILIVTSNTAIDLSGAAALAWSTPAPVQGKGVYDSQRWAVVFKYDSVYVAPGVTLRFLNHPTTAPVVWLVNRGVNIAGTVSLDGEVRIPLSGVPAVPGPGGFRGGKAGTATSGGGGPGMGPGGGGYSPNNSYSAGGGGYSSPGVASPVTAGGVQYGNAQILPLIGGSGGGGTSVDGGGAGGGALLIAARRSVIINGTIRANGGSPESNGGSGSGGAIRVIADQIAGSGLLFALGGTSGVGPYGGGAAGRIRLEANTTSYSGGSSPTYTLHLPVGSSATLWPPANSPTVAIATVGGQPVPIDPTGNLFGGDTQISSATTVPVTISATNVPSNATMTLRAVLVSGQNAVTVNATLTSGDASASTWTATLPSIANNAYTLLQVHVTLP